MNHTCGSCLLRTVKLLIWNEMGYLDKAFILGIRD